MAFWLLQVSDQGASLAGGGGYSKGHVKVTLGTGGFLNLNTGDKPHTSCKGTTALEEYFLPNLDHNLNKV